MPRLRAGMGALVVLAGGLAACSGPAPSASPRLMIAMVPPAALPSEPPILYPSQLPSFTEVGLASWYGRSFHHKPTASGERYDMNDLTAAHPSLPLDTIARVTNLDNNRSVLVRINDRGPFAQGRVIDLSRGAARLLDMTRAGVAPVRVEVWDADQFKAVAQNLRAYAR